LIVFSRKNPIFIFYLLYSFLLSFGDYKTLHHIPYVIIATLTISVHCFWFLICWDQERIFFSLFLPTFCAAVPRERKKIWKLYQFFKNQEKLKLIPKHCDSMNFVMIIKSRLLYILYMLIYREIKKMKEKQTILQKIQKKI